MIFPENLKKGDKVALVAPSSPVSEETAVSARRFFEERGYAVLMSPLVWSSLHGYEAGDPKKRAGELARAFRDPEVRGVFCLRGGHSSCRVLEHLNLGVVRDNPKIFVGYSDITSLHVLFNQRCGLVTFHGPMVSTNLLKETDGYSLSNLERLLAMEPGNRLSFRNPKGIPMIPLKEGRTEGVLTGGNLALLTSLLGTPFEVDTRDKILLIEEVGETVSRVARMLSHLKLSGKLDQASGIVLGNFTDCSNPLCPEYGVEELLKDFFEGFQGPVLAGVQTGHESPMGSVPLGLRAELDSGATELVFIRD